MVEGSARNIRVRVLEGLFNRDSHYLATTIYDRPTAHSPTELNLHLDGLGGTWVVECYRLNKAGQNGQRWLAPRNRRIPKYSYFLPRSWWLDSHGET